MLDLEMESAIGGGITDTEVGDECCFWCGWIMSLCRCKHHNDCNYPYTRCWCEEIRSKQVSSSK